MSDPEDRLLDVALRLTDGAPVEWDLERTFQPEADGILESMQLIAEIAAGHHATAATPPLFTWGPLRVLNKLGEGSFGEVYAAWDPALQRQVALKLGRERGETDAMRSVRRLDEARRLARLHHPNVLTVQGVDVHDGRTGIWFDLLRGRTLEDDLRLRGPMSAREAALVGMDLCSAVAAVHAAGLVHGDIKTRNVMREGIPGSTQNSGRVVLMDFGSAHESVPGVETSTASPGTPLFSAPEVLRGQAPSVRSDLYSLGVVLFRLVTARYPVEAASISELNTKLQRGERATLRDMRPDLPLAYVDLVEGALATEPARRFAAAGAMERALVAVLGNGGEHDRRVAMRLRSYWGRARPWVAAAGAAGAVAIAASSGWRWARPILNPSTPLLTVASTPRLTMRGPSQSGNMGSAVWGGFGRSVGSVATALDDPWGDGIPGVLVGASGEERSRGRAYLLRGGIGADSIPDLVFEGERLADLFASCIVVLGDVNRDGHDDFGIGAPFSDAGEQNAGRVYVYFGGPNLDNRADVVLTGSEPDAQFGFATAGLGDVNGDGYDDIAVGSPFAPTGNYSGRASVFLGGSPMDANLDFELTSDLEAESFGSSIAGPGDLNADGFPDFVIGAPNSKSFLGRAYVYFGGPNLDARYDLVFEGRAAGECFGTVASAGDHNGDGYRDLLVGSPANGRPGAPGSAALFYGGPQFDAKADRLLLGKIPGSYFGGAVAGIGDVNQDGFDDVMVNARFDENGGKAYVYFGGKPPDSQVDLELLGESFGGAGLGACASAGDFFRDGFPDLFAGDLWNGGGHLVVLDVARFIVVRPRPGEIVDGSSMALGWLGSERADISISADAGATWNRLQRAVGGQSQNRLVLELPNGDADSIQVRIEPSNGSVPGSVSVAFARRRVAPDRR